MEISIKGEKLFTLGGFPITNSYLSALVVLFGLGLIITLYHIQKNSKKSTTLTIIIDTIVFGVYDFVNGILGKHTWKLFTLLLSSLLFIVCSNWFGLIPGVGSIKLYEAKPMIQTTSELPTEISTNTKAFTPEKSGQSIHLFRAPTADLNTTIALALVAVIVTNYWGFKQLGVRAHLGKFFSLSSPINFFVGILELISELSRILSYAFRLFGNIFAGEVVIAVMAFLMPVILPFPFFAFEIFVGAIQGFIFIALFTVFSSLAMQEPHHS